MKSKTSLFNRTVFFNLLRRHWVLFAGYFCIMGAAILIPLINSLQSTGIYATALEHYASFLELLQFTPSTVFVITFIAAPLAATMLFSYLYNARHTGLMTSLPITRESMFLSVSAAGAAGFTFCNVVILALALLIELVYGDVSLLGLAILFVIMTLTVIVFFGMAAFCCMLTGNIFAGPTVYVIFNFLTVGAEALVNALLRKVVFGMGTRFSPKTMFLSPIMQVYESVYLDCEYIRSDGGTLLDYTWSMEGIGVLVVYALVGLVFLALALQLYKHRRMEVAGDTIAIEILKPVFRLCMAVGGGLLVASFINETLYGIQLTGGAMAAFIAVMLIIGGILGYFIAQMLITKSVSVFRRGWKSVGLYVLCVIALVTAVETDLFGYEKHIPEAEDVESVYITVYDGYNSISFDEPENIRAVIRLHNNIIANRAFHELDFGSPGTAMPLDAEPGADFHKQTIQFEYTLKNEDYVIRRYSLSYDPDAIRSDASEIRTLEALLNTEEAIAERCIAPFPVTVDNIRDGWINYVDAETYENMDFVDMSPSELAHLYNDCILPDIADGRLGVYNLIEDKAYAKSKYDCNIYLNLYGKRVDHQDGAVSYEDYFDVALFVTTDASRTLEFLAERGIHPATVYDSAVYHGYDYSDLGRYRVDGEDNMYLNYDMTVSYTKPIIGGAETATAIEVIG